MGLIIFFKFFILSDALLKDNYGAFYNNSKTIFINVFETNKNNYKQEGETKDKMAFEIKEKSELDFIFIRTSTKLTNKHTHTRLLNPNLGKPVPTRIFIRLS